MTMGQSSKVLPADPSQGRRPKVRLSKPVEQLVTRFELPARRELRRLIRTSPRFADLAESFPAAAYTLAARHGDRQTRLHAARLVREGAKLKDVAQALNLPLWLRRLPPSAFIGKIGPLPDSESFARRIATRLPSGRTDPSFWLASLTFASTAADEDFALWLADQSICSDGAQPERLFPVLAAYAWYSKAPHTSAHGLIVVPWRQEIAFDTALCAAKSWLNRLRLVMQLEPGKLVDSWLRQGEAMGLQFVPLLNQEDILEEAQAMQNCADQYADRLAREKCRLFSVRRGTTRVATLEIGPHPRETGILAITQLKARHNMPASTEIWQAAHAWLANQTGLKRLLPVVAPERGLNARVWDELMEPYRQSRDGAGWLPSVPTQIAFSRLDSDMTDLARRAGVTSWLFT